ncbi:DUF3124 domain-containing protein [bacterium]|nr:DUF3124 domain-containing protein [bacterium]
MNKNRLPAFLIVVSCLYLVSCPSLSAAEGRTLSRGQTVYVPAYSHIYSGNRERAFMLAITLSIRNVDQHHPIRIIVVDYYETQGKLLKKYLAKPLILGPLESLRYVIPEKDKSGGSGANFIVEWNSDRSVNPPVVESIMIGTQNQQGISFTSQGRVLVPSGP